MTKEPASHPSKPAVPALHNGYWLRPAKGCVSELQTMVEEERDLIAAYRKADARGKRSIIDNAESTAEDWPEKRPRLVLVPECRPMENIS